MNSRQFEYFSMLIGLTNSTIILMSEINKRRFVFIDFENLKKVKFKKLEKVCDRVFIFIDAKEKSIPFTLVQQIQRFGKAVKWIPVHKPINGNLDFHIAFLLGKFHQKINKQTEFAVLSDNISLDPLVSFVNAQGRSCLRVKSRAVSNVKAAPASEIKKQESGKQAKDQDQSPLLKDATFNNGIIKSTADNTIQRLKRTGNRPVEVSMLRSYILLHNQELTKRGNVDQIIKEMEHNKKIAIRGGQVTYHF